MSSYTPNLSLPYPALTDVPNVPSDIAALANAVDSTLGTPLLQGPGATTNIVSGGVNRTTQPLLVYTTSATVTITAGSGWSFTTSGTTFHGCGSFHVTTGNNTNGLILCTTVIANCSIAGGNLTVAGGALTASVASNALVGLSTGANITIHVTAYGW